MKWKFWPAAALAAGAALVLLTGAPPARTITIASMPPGTSWYVFGATLANLLERQLPPGASVEVIARGGGTGNPALVERGQATIGIAQTAVVVWARDGEPRAFRGVKHTSIRALAGGLNSVWMTAAVREDYVARTGNDTLEKALLGGKPPRIIMKPPGSAIPIAADMILEMLGTSRDRIRARGGDVIQVQANQIPEMLRDNRADLYFEGAIRGHPALTEAMTTVPMRLLELPEPIVAALAAKGLKAGHIPVWFRGQRQPVRAANFGTVLIVHKDLPEDLAYLVTKTVCDNREAMVRAHKAWADFDPARGWRSEETGIPLHPGAARYYKEKGWL